MPGTNNPLGVVQAFRMALTKLDSNGVPTPAAGKRYVTASLVSAVITPVYKDGTVIEQENGEGVTCVYFKGNDSLQRVDVQITVCTPDPYLMEFLAGCAVLDKGSGSLGWALPSIGEIEPTDIGIELWAKRVDDGVVDSAEPYDWHLLPRFRNGRLGAVTLGNNAVVPQITGQGYENMNWFDGPLNDWPVDSHKAWQAVPWTSVPAASTSLQAVSAS